MLNSFSNIHNPPAYVSLFYDIKFSVQIKVTTLCSTNNFVIVKILSDLVLCLLLQIFCEPQIYLGKQLRTSQKISLSFSKKYS